MQVIIHIDFLAELDEAVKKCEELRKSYPRLEVTIVVSERA